MTAGRYSRAGTSPAPTHWLLLAACLIVGCGGAKGKDEADPMVLLTAGRYSEARVAVLNKKRFTNADRAIFALSTIAENPGVSSGKEAASALRQGTDDLGAAASAFEMMNLAFEIPQPVSYEISFIAAEAALGALGHGPLAATGGQSDAAEAGRRLGVAILERVYLALVPPDSMIEPARLLDIWNGCFAISKGSTEAGDEVQAWTLFRSVGGLAAMMSKAAPDTELTKALLTAAINTVENNPSIAIAARCDLASPFDDLKSALSHNLELLGRLEMAVAAAVGCSRGTYAPETR